MSGDANEAVRLKEQKDAERGIDADSDSANQTGGGSEPDVSPPPAGYGERDPQTEMPVVPTAPETHEDEKHAEKIMPSGDKPRPAHG